MKSRSFVAMSSILIAILGHSQANAQIPPPVLVCGLEVYASPTGFPAAESSSDEQPGFAAPSNLSGDPCEEGETLFGPARFERTTGKPVQEISEFILEADADVCIISKSGAKGKASLFVDGINVAEPEDFDDQIDVHTGSLTAGSHGLGVRTVGKPGGYLDIEIRQLASGGGGGDPDLPAPGEVQIDAATGALDMVSADGSVRLQNVATDHPLLTPNGDGHHDTTVLQALTTPLVDLPGKDDGSVDYFVDWEFQVTDLFTCNTIDTGLSGVEQINSPTLVTTDWDGTDVTGAALPSGNYAYVYNVNVVDEFGVNFGGITAPGFGHVIEFSPEDPDYDESAEQLPQCTESNLADCICFDSDGEPVPDSDCAFAFVRNLLPGFPGTIFEHPNYYKFGGGFGENYDPSAFLDLSFITTRKDPDTDRYTVTVDLRDYNAKGLVPKQSGFWDNEAHLRRWVSQMTGVPEVDANGNISDSLFNFDYVQIGNSTGVNLFGPTFHGFNHFFLDAITDDFGRITVGSVSTDIAGQFNDDNEIVETGDGHHGVPPQYVVAGREGEECTNSGNTDGTDNLRSKFCAYNTAVKIGEVTDLGIYALRTTMFDMEYSDEETKQDALCVFEDFFHCGVGTSVVPADSLEIESSYYVETSTGPGFTRVLTTQKFNTTGMSVTVDRASGEDGVCSRAEATRNGLAVRMDAADGSVPDSCIINGIF